MGFYQILERDNLISSLTERLTDVDDEFALMDFLRQLVYDRPNFTRAFITFEDVGPLPDDEYNERNENNEDEFEMGVDDDASLASLAIYYSITLLLGVLRRSLCAHMIQRRRHRQSAITCAVTVPCAQRIQ